MDYKSTGAFSIFDMCFVTWDSAMGSGIGIVTVSFDVQNNHSNASLLFSPTKIPQNASSMSRSAKVSLEILMNI